MYGIGRGRGRVGTLVTIEYDMIRSFFLAFMDKGV